MRSVKQLTANVSDEELDSTKAKLVQELRVDDKVGGLPNRESFHVKRFIRSIEQTRATRNEYRIIYLFFQMLSAQYD